MASLRKPNRAPSAPSELKSRLSLLRSDPGGMPVASAWGLLALAEAGEVLSEDAETPWREARELWSTLTGWQHVCAYIECRLANLLGQSEEASDLLSSATTRARRLGSTTLQKLALAVSARHQVASDALGDVETKKFTPREREVLSYVVDGASNSNIATSLGLSEKTVSVYVSSLLRKVGAGSRTELALWAVQTTQILGGSRHHARGPARPQGTVLPSGSRPQQ